MAVFFEAATPGDGDWAAFTDAIDVEFNHTSNGGEVCALVCAAFTASDLSLGPFVIGDNELDDLTRRATYGGQPMTSVGVVQWSTSQAWTEVFAAFDIPAGRNQVRVKVDGGAASKRHVRATCVTYTGVDGVGTPVSGSGTGTSMSISATAAAADRVVGVFGTKDGIGAFNQTQRTVTNATTAMLVGDAAGTGSTMALTATRQKSGVWGGFAVPLLAAATVATADPLIVEPRLDAIVRREPRLGGLRRQVFTVPLED
mgnify:CR=1 FL=1